MGKPDIACPASGNGGVYIRDEFAVALHETNPSRFIMRVLLLSLLGLSLLSCGNDSDASDNPDDISIREREEMKAYSINPETSIRLLRPEELSAYTPQQLRLVRNEIFARHGYIFKSGELQRYFEEQPWYYHDSSFTQEMITEIERQNVQALLEEEEKRKLSPSSAQYSPGDATASKSSIDAIPPNAKAAIAEWGNSHGPAYNNMMESDPFDYWEIAYGDVDGDNDRDAAVIFIGYTEAGWLYKKLAVFINKNGRMEFDSDAKIGAVGDWLVDKVEKVGPNGIVVTASLYHADDQQCCPSGRDIITLAYTDEHGVHLSSAPPTRSNKEQSLWQAQHRREFR